MNQQKDSWPVTWDANRQLQRLAVLAASPAQRLAWLEDMIALAYRAGALHGEIRSAVPRGEATSADSKR
jgi:hypothetical protein